MREIDRLRRVIRNLHGSKARTCGRSRYRGRRRRDRLEGRRRGLLAEGHPKAGLAYAWSVPTDDGGRSYMAVLGVPPIQTAADAVRAVIVAGAAQR
jgi:hypothetical protein